MDERNPVICHKTPKVKLQQTVKSILAAKKVDELNLRAKEKDEILNTLKKCHSVLHNISSEQGVDFDEKLAVNRMRKSSLATVLPGPSGKLQLGVDNSLCVESPNGLKSVEGESEVVIPFYIFLPESSFHQKWDITMIIILFYTAVVVPYRIGFEAEPLGVYFWVELFIDVFFWLDIGLSFFTAVNSHGVLVTNHKRIAVIYLKTWFIFDVIASLPSVLPYDVNTFAKLAKLPRFLKLLKILRLLKFFRAFNLQKFVMYVENNYEVHNGISRILNIFATMCMVTHILGCLWHLIPLLESENRSYATANSVNNLDPESWLVRSHLTSSSLSKRYIVSIYWAFTTLTTVGYGDVIGRTSAELIFSIFVMIIGVTWYAFVVSSMATVLASFDSYNQLYREKQLNLNNFCRAANIPPFLRKRLRAYLQYHYHDSAKKQTYASDAVLEDMSPELRIEVLMFINRNLIKSIPFFIGKSARLVTIIVGSLQPAFCHSNQFLIREGEAATGIFFMMRGKAVTLKGSVVKDVHEKGSSVGEIGCILSDCYWGSVKANVLCEMQVFPINHINEVMIEFPKFAETMRNTAVEKLNSYLSNCNSVDNRGLFNIVNELRKNDDKKDVKLGNGKVSQITSPTSTQSSQFSVQDSCRGLKPKNMIHSGLQEEVTKLDGNDHEDDIGNKQVGALANRLKNLEKLISDLMADSNAKISDNKELILQLIEKENAEPL